MISFSKAPRILVTGAGGYLGAHIVNELRARGHSVTGSGRHPNPGDPGWVQCDLLDRAGTDYLLESTRPDVIIHAAAQVPKGIGDYNDDATGSVQMVENIIASRPNSLFLISSMTVYGNGVSGRISESMPLNPSSSYAQGKVDAENLARRSGVPGYAIRIPGLYGPPRKGGLVYNTLAAIRRKEIPSLPASPLTWAAMDVRDAARAISTLVPGAPDRFTPINIGYSGAVSINRLIRILQLELGFDFEYATVHPEFEFDLGLFEEIANYALPPFETAIRHFSRQSDA